MSDIWSLKLCGKAPQVPPCGEPNVEVNGTYFVRVCNMFPQQLATRLIGLGVGIGKLFQAKPAGEEDCASGNPIPRPDGSCCACSVREYHAVATDHKKLNGIGNNSSYLNAKVGGKEVIVRVTSLAAYNGVAAGIWAVMAPNVKLDTCSPASLSNPCIAPTVAGCGCNSCEQVDKTTQEVLNVYAPSAQRGTRNTNGSGGGRADGHDYPPTFTGKYQEIHPDYIQDYGYYMNDAAPSPLGPNHLQFIPQMRDTANAINYHLTKYNYSLYTHKSGATTVYSGLDDGIAAWQAASTNTPIAPAPAPNPVRPELQWIAPKSTVAINENLFITGTYFGDAVLWKLDNSLQLVILGISSSSLPTPHTQAVEGNTLVVGEKYEVILADDYSNVSASGVLNAGDVFTATNSTPLTVGQSVKSTLDVDFFNRLTNSTDDYNPVDGSYRGLNFRDYQAPHLCGVPSSGTYQGIRVNYALADMTGTVKEVAPNTFEYLIGTRFGYNKFTVDSSGESITSIDEFKVQPVMKPVNGVNYGSSCAASVYSLGEYPDEHRLDSGATILDGEIYSISYEGVGVNYSAYGGPASGSIGDFFRVSGGDVILSGSESVYKYQSKTGFPSFGVLGKLAVNSATELDGGEVILSVASAKKFNYSNNCNPTCGNHLRYNRFTYSSIVPSLGVKPLEFFVDDSKYGATDLVMAEAFNLGTQWQHAIDFNGSEYLLSILNGEVYIQSVVANLPITHSSQALGGVYHHYPIKYGSFYYTGHGAIPFKIVDNGGLPEIQLGTHGIGPSPRNTTYRSNAVPITLPTNCTYLIASRKPTGGNGYHYQIMQNEAPPFSP